MDTPEINQNVANQQVPQPTNKGSVNMVFIVIIICILALLLSAGAYLFIRSTKNSSLPSQNAQNTSLTPTIAPRPLAVFQDGELSFDYDASWKRISSNALFRLQFDNPEPTGAADITYFFNPDNWIRAKEIMAALKSDLGFEAATGRLPIAAAVDVLIPIMDVDVHRRANISAQEFAYESTKGICKGTIIASYNKESQPDKSKIKEIVVAGKKAYLELPQSTCDYKLTSIFFDSSRKKADGKSDSFQIIFNRAMDLEHLSPEQQIIFNSIKLQ